MKAAERRRETLKLPAQLGDAFTRCWRLEALDGDQLHPGAVSARKAQTVPGDVEQWWAGDWSGKWDMDLPCPC